MFELPFANTSQIKIHGANMGPTWVLSAPDGPHVGPMNLASREHQFELIFSIIDGQKSWRSYRQTTSDIVTWLMSVNKYIMSDFKIQLRANAEFLSIEHSNQNTQISFIWKRHFKYNLQIVSHYV